MDLICGGRLDPLWVFAGRSLQLLAIAECYCPAFYLSRIVAYNEQLMQESQSYLSRWRREPAGVWRGAKRRSLTWKNSKCEQLPGKLLKRKIKSL